MSAHWEVISGLNWVGDSIMAMPSLQAYRSRHPDTALLMVVKPTLAPLWGMHRAVDEIVELTPGLGGAWRAAGLIRERKCRRAFVWPHSFRSALVPFLARVPERIGMPGHWRGALLTDVVESTGGPGREHQAWEYLDLMGVGDQDGVPPSPTLTLDADATVTASSLLPGDDVHWIGLLPGAARGPSKRWPPGHFIDLGRRLAADPTVRIAVMGSAGEKPLCEDVALGIGDAACALAGRTPFALWAACLARCAVVVANDSGGMHLAAAVGTPVVALYGLTDPAKTGPLGPACILQQGQNRNREITRDSAEARLSLASISPGQVYEAVNGALPR